MFTRFFAYLNYVLYAKIRVTDLVKGHVEVPAYVMLVTIDSSVI